jgi:hypothetical protein
MRNLTPPRHISTLQIVQLWNLEIASDKNVMLCKPAAPGGGIFCGYQPAQTISLLSVSFSGDQINRRAADISGNKVYKDHHGKYEWKPYRNNADISGAEASETKFLADYHTRKDGIFCNTDARDCRRSVGLLNRSAASGPWSYMYQKLRQ